MTVVFVAILVQSSRGSNDGNKRPLSSVHIVIISLMFSSRSPAFSFVHGRRESPEMERDTHNEKTDEDDGRQTRRR